MAKLSRIERYPYIVKRLNRDGSIDRSRWTHINEQLDATRTMAQAEARVAELEKLNPRTKYIIICR